MLSKVSDEGTQSQSRSNKECLATRFLLDPAVMVEDPTLITPDH